MYDREEDVGKSDALAIKFNKRDAEQGYAGAQFNLGFMYEKGQGINQSDEEAFKWYKRAAEQGYAGAQFNLGVMYEKGQGINQSDEEAFKWYKRAAKKGDAGAQLNLGFMYDEGCGIHQSDEEAFKWYKRAAEQGYAQAQFNLGFMYQKGQGINQSDDEAFKWYKRAAKQGYAGAQFNLGFMYGKGQGIHQSDEEAFKWYKRAAEQGDAHAQFNLGFMCQKVLSSSQPDGEAFMWYKRAAEQGNKQAQFKLGFMYQKGQGIPQSDEEAFKWYKRAAEQGDAGAQFNLGFMYDEGCGIFQSDEEAFKWYKKAAEQGDAGAQFNLGVMYQKGQGIPQFDEEAFKWYKRAAEQGDAGAQLNLGFMHEKGLGIPQHAGKAFKWYKRAAEQGDAGAQFNLGNMYHKGQGISQSDDEAFKWYKRAAVQGDTRAQFNLELIYEKGQGIPQSDEEAFKSYKRAAEQGDAQGQFNLAVMYQQGQGFPRSDEEALKWYKRAAEQGDAEAQFNLGNRYRNGQGIPQSDEEAFKWYKRAAEQGHAGAQFNLGNRYRMGQGIPQSYEEAFKCYTRAAEQGNAQADVYLGDLYQKGQGIPQSDEEAFKCYKRAAEQENAQAHVNLGDMYRKGQGIPQHDGEAFNWYKRAAEQGNTQAQFNLGFMYAQGQGIPQSDEEAFKWYKRGAEQGHAGAQVNVGVRYQKGQGIAQSDEEAFKWIKRAAAQGNEQAHVNLGNLYHKGCGSLQSDEEAFKWYKRAAEQGVALAQLFLGISYFMGHGMLKNEEKALSLLKKSSLEFSVSDELYMYISYSSLENICSGINLIYSKMSEIKGTTLEHFSIAFPYLEKIINKNLGKNFLDVAKPYQELVEFSDYQRQFDLGILYHFGIGVRQDLTRAFEWYEEASQHGNEVAGDLWKKFEQCFLPSFIKKIFPLSSIKRSPETTDEDVFKQLETVIDEEDPRILYQLGRMHLYGWGTKKDQDEAVMCFKKAIKKERYPLALKALADVYQLNDEISPIEVIRLYRHAAKQGDAGATAAIRDMADEYVTEAIYALARAYEEGWGIAKDEEEAFELYQRAAFEGKYPKAQHAFAIKTPKDPSAPDLLSRAAGGEEWKTYLKAVGKKYHPKDLEEIEQKGPGYYKAQQALADLYLKGCIIPFKTFDNVLEAYENALRLHDKAFASQGKHLHMESIIQAKSKYDQLKKSEEDGTFSFQEEMADILKKFTLLYEKKEEYNPDFLYQVTYLYQKTFGQETAKTVQDMIQHLSAVSEKKKQTKISKGLMDRLIKTVEMERIDELTELSILFDLALLKKSWTTIPSPEEFSQVLKLSEKAFKDPQIEIFNSCIQTPDQSVEQIYFRKSVKKILGMFNNLEAKGLITKEGLVDSEEGKVGTDETLRAFLMHNQSDSRFAFRIVRLSDMLDLKSKNDPVHVAAQLMSWAKAGNFCRERSEEETYQYYLAQITDPDQDLNDLGKDYWTLELRVALSLARLREQSVDALVPQHESERVHQVANLKKKVRQELSLVGDAEYSQDTLEGISVKPKYQRLSSDVIKEKILEKYTADYIAGHIAKEFESSLLPFEKLFRRLRFQFLREELSKASEQSLHHLDQRLFKEEDFILSDACDQQYMNKQFTLMINLSCDLESTFIDWQTLKGKSFEVARKRLEEEFYEDEMTKFSTKGAKAILKGMGYLEEDTSFVSKK